MLYCKLSLALTRLSLSAIIIDRKIINWKSITAIEIQWEKTWVWIACLLAMMNPYALSDILQKISKEKSWNIQIRMVDWSEESREKRRGGGPTPEKKGKFPNSKICKIASDFSRLDITHTFNNSENTTELLADCWLKNRTQQHLILLILIQLNYILSYWYLSVVCWMVKSA